MAVGEILWPDMHPVDGVRMATANARIKDNDRDDTLVFEIAQGACVSAVFTQNAFCAAPVIVAKKHLALGNTRYLVINSGNANACTGEAGIEAAERTCQAIAELGEVHPSQVLPFSTGVIGEPLAYKKITAVVPDAIAELSGDAWGKAATAIMTTDTCRKGASEIIDVEGQRVTISGIAKGAGMINPNMATMLAFVATDANVAPSVADTLSRLCAVDSFNRITIDGDTSTNDACVLIATNKAGNPIISDESSQAFANLYSAVKRVYQRLAQAIVRDGEGATKFITIKVQGGATPKECDDVAYAIAHSPLVKTAMFASDPNWGRIICAIGYAGVPHLDVRKVTVKLDDVLIVSGGERAASYSEKLGQEIVEKEAFTIFVDLARGSYEGVIWTSDLSHEYVRINAEYRT